MSFLPISAFWEAGWAASKGLVGFIPNLCLISFIRSMDGLFMLQISCWCVETSAARIWELLMEGIGSNLVVLLRVVL